MNKKLFLSAILFCLGLIVFTLVIPFRFDMTHNSAWTFSTYTASQLQSLSETIYIRWYRSKELYQLTPSARYIEDLLKEFQNVSNNRIVFILEDPKETGLINEVSQLGIIPREITQTENDKEKITSIYSGFIIEYGINKKTIPFLLEPLEIEYEFMKNIDALLKESTNTNYNKLQLVIASEYEHYYSYLIPYLTYAGYTIQRVDLTLSTLNHLIPLLVVGSKNISIENVEKLEQFYDLGGSVAFFTSANTVRIDSDWATEPLAYNPLLHFLTKQGFNLEPSLVLDLSHFRITMPSLDGTKYEYSNYPFWVISLPAFINQDEILTQGVQTIQFFWPGRIILSENNSLIPLIQSTPSAVIMHPPYTTDPFGNSLSLFNGDTQRIQSVLAAYTHHSSRMFVVSDEYMISDIIEYTGSDHNLTFLTTVVEWLSYKDDIFPLKYKTLSSVAPERSEEESIALLSMSRIVYFVITPLILVACWLAYMLRRKINYDKKTR